MEVPCELLLHPELLTNEQLTYIIQQRYLRVDNIQNMRRDELLDVFRQYCLPYGQRRYRDSGRGKVLNKTRHMTLESPQNVNIMSKTQSRQIHSNCERLKPPPDLLTGHMKRIKLDNKTVPIHNVNNSKRKMSTDSVSSIEDTPPPKKDKKPITWP